MPCWPPWPACDDSPLTRGVRCTPASGMQERYCIRLGANRIKERQKRRLSPGHAEQADQKNEVGSLVFWLCGVGEDSPIARFRLQFEPLQVSGADVIEEVSIVFFLTARRITPGISARSNNCAHTVIGVVLQTDQPPVFLLCPAI